MGTVRSNRTPLTTTRIEFVKRLSRPSRMLNGSVNSLTNISRTVPRVREGFTYSGYRRFGGSQLDWCVVVFISGCAKISPTPDGSACSSTIDGHDGESSRFDRRKPYQLGVMGVCS